MPGRYAVVRTPTSAMTWDRRSREAAVAWLEPWQERVRGGCPEPDRSPQSGIEQLRAGIATIFDETAGVPRDRYLRPAAEARCRG